MPPKPLPKGARPSAPAPQSPAGATLPMREGATFGNTLRSTSNLIWDPSGDPASAAEAATVAERLARSDPAFARYLRRLRDSDKMFFTTRREFLDEARGLAAPASPTSGGADDAVGSLREAVRSAVGSGALAETVVPPAVDLDGRSVLVRWTHSRWPELVAREYIAKKHRYGARLSDTRRLGSYVALLLAVLIASLYCVWPVWGFLIDVDAGEHYKTLGVASSASTSEIKKAYRTMARKWHPDQNPDCGEMCKAKMRDIQHAYDVLLSKGDRQTASEIKRKTQEAIEQLLAFVFYRGYTMAFNTATFVSYFVVVSASIAADRATRAMLDGWVTLAIKVLVLAVFCVFTVAYVTGPNIMMLLISGYRVVLQLREDRSAEKTVRGAFDDDDGGARTSGGRDLVKATTLGNFDLPSNLLLFVLPAAVGHVAYVWTHTVSASAAADAPAGTPVFSLGKLLFQLVFGLVFVCSHLIQMPPNLFDNLRMLECQIPQPYFRTAADPVTGRLRRSVTVTSFLMAEVGILVDDVFAFVTQVPAPYRIAVFVCHALYLVQMFTMPWAQPMDLASARSARLHEKLLARRAAEQAAAAAANGGQGSDEVLSRYSASVRRLVDLVGRSGPAGEDDGGASPPRDSAQPDTSAPPSERPMTQRELQRLVNLDRDRVIVEQVRADVAAYSCTRGAGLARLKAVQDELAREPMHSAMATAEHQRAAVGITVTTGFTIAALAAVVAAVAAVALPVQQADLTFRHWRQFRNSEPTLSRNPYDVTAAMEGGGVPLLRAAVGDDIRTRTSGDFAFSNSGLGAWGLSVNGGDRAQKRIALNALNGGGEDAKRKSSAGKARGGKKRKQQQQQR